MKKKKKKKQERRQFWRHMKAGKLISIETKNCFYELKKKRKRFRSNFNIMFYNLFHFVK